MISYRRLVKAELVTTASWTKVRTQFMSKDEDYISHVVGAFITPNSTYLFGLFFFCPIISSPCSAYLLQQFFHAIHPSYNLPCNMFIFFFFFFLTIIYVRPVHLTNYHQETHHYRQQYGRDTQDYRN
jgi:hypothetical protein